MDKKLHSAGKEIAKHGRNGDNRILHVSDAELKGLASLAPGGKLPINPKTGHPEAFFFLPFLAGLTSAVAPAAAATTAALPAATAGLGTLASATLPAAATTAATTALPAATAASALPAATTGAGALMAPASSAAGLGGLVAPGATAALPASGSALTAGAAGGAAGSAEAAGAGLASFANPAGLSATGLTGAFPAAPAAAGAAKGGLGGLLGGLGGMDMNQMLQYGALGAMMMPQGGGGDDDEDAPDVDKKSYDRGDPATPSNGGADGGVTGEFDFFPKSRYYAEGGLASLADADEDGSSRDDEQIVEATIAAIKGQVPNPQPIIQMFVQEFGQQALADLIQRVQAEGSGDGMSDSVPAMITNGQQQAPANLSEGEWVVPADVVSHLGNGSTMAGSRKLQGMVDSVRSARNAGNPKQIQPEDHLPA